MAVPGLAKHESDKAMLIDEVLNVALEDENAHLFNGRALVEGAQTEPQLGMPAKKTYAV